MAVARRHKRGMLRDNRGVTAMEFSFVAPVLVLFMMGVIEFSVMMFTSSVMEGSIVSTSRLGKTGHVEEGVSRQQLIFDTLMARTGGLLDPEEVVITTVVYPSFDTIGDAEPYTDTNHNNAHDNGEPYTDVNGNGSWDQDMGVAGLGDADDIVVYNVSYPWRLVTPLMSELLGSTITLSARTVVKNEPFDF